MVEVTSGCLEPAEEFIERLALRGFDAVHLCSALFMKATGFASFDGKLREAARSIGLRVLP